MALSLQIDLRKEYLKGLEGETGMTAHDIQSRPGLFLQEMTQ